MSEEIELAAKSTGAVVGALIEASGMTAPMQEVTRWLASWLHPRLVASAAKQMMAAVEKLERDRVRPGAVDDEQMRMLLEEGAREPDECLKEKWANLLARGLVDDHEPVPRAFAAVLGQLEPAEAKVLDAMFDEKGAVVIAAGEGEWFQRGRPVWTLANLVRLGLVEHKNVDPERNFVRPAGAPDAVPAWGVTSFGVSFVRACRSPVPRS